MSGRHKNVLVLAFLLGGFVLSLYLLTGSSDLLNNGDTDLRYQTAQAMVDHHRLWIADPMWHDTRTTVGRGGHLYAFYGPGQPVLMVPLYIAGKVIAHHLHLPYDVTTMYAARSIDLFLGAALAVSFFILAVVVGYSPRIGAVLAAIFATATVAWPDAQSALEQTQVNLFLCLAVIGLALYVYGRSRRGVLAWSGLMLGCAVLTRYDAVLFLAIAIVYVFALGWWRRSVRDGLGDAVFLGLAVVPALLGVALWDYARFGSPFITGLNEQTYGEPFWQGLGGLLVSPGKGIIWYLPLVWALPWTLPSFVRRRFALSVLLGSIVVVPLLFYANILYWHGDPSWGPRYLYTGVPYLILPLGEALQRWSRTALPLKMWISALVLAGLGLSLCAVSVTQWRFWYRLEAMQQQHVDAATWSGQPFRWGALHYHYYWNPRQSPLLLQVDDVYQVTRLQFGTQRYLLNAWPDPLVSNPAFLYPVNTYAFWWLDPLHPLLGQRTRDALAALLLLIAGGCFAGLCWQVRRMPDLRRSSSIPMSPVELATADRI